CCPPCLACRGFFRLRIGRSSPSTLTPRTGRRTRAARATCGDSAMSQTKQTVTYLPEESAGRAPGRARLQGRRILIVGAGQDDRGVVDPPIGNGRAMSLLFAREG